MTRRRYHTSSSPIGETLETRHLSIVGRSPSQAERLAGRVLFWRRYALALTAFFVVRIVLDVLGQ